MATDGLLCSGTLCAFDGRGYDLAGEVVAHASCKLPAETAAAVRAFHEYGHGSLRDAVRVREVLTSRAAELIARLATSYARRPPIFIAALGVIEPGVWLRAPGGIVDWMPLVDGAALAETTGLNVVSEFPVRDLQNGGQGGPLNSVAEWLLLRKLRRARLRLELGDTFRLTYIPRRKAGGDPSEVLSVDVGPGLALADALVARLSGGLYRQDDGTTGAQGKALPEVVERLLNESYFLRPLPRWRSPGVDAEPFMRLCLRALVEEQATPCDLMASVAEFFMVAIQKAIDETTAGAGAFDEIILTGRGAQHGLLGSLLRDRYPHAKVTSSDAIGLPERSLDAASAAVLTALLFDQTPASLPRCTGAATPKLLGRLAPGSPQNWHRLCKMLGGNDAWMSLRAAM
ncbi:MAG TPA: anhydro-N-acetylmuramic acid kinase [Pirellulales bacterium]